MTPARRTAPGPRHGPRRLHVVHLVMALDVGGLERVVIDLVERTDRARFRVTVVCLKRRGVLADRVERGGTRVVSLGCDGGGLRVTLARAVRCLAALRPDVLHTHNPHPHLVGSVAGAVLGLRVVNTKHGRNDPDRRTAVLLNRFAALLSGAVVAVSADAARVATDVERVPRRKVRLIRNGIDLTPFPPDPAPRTGPVRVIHVARLNLIKDQATLLEAARLVADRVPDFRLTVVGDGPLRDELHRLRDRLGLGDRVEFLGERADVPALLAGADVFVLSSLQEGLSLTLLEAMAAGLAVVATDVGGNREVVVPGETGLLVPSRSPGELAGAILACLADPPGTRAMGCRGRVRVAAEFSLDRAVRAYEDLYDALGRGRAGRPR